jgi:hypothetical protein
MNPPDPLLNIEWGTIRWRFSGVTGRPAQQGSSPHLIFPYFNTLSTRISLVTQNSHLFNDCLAPSYPSCDFKFNKIHILTLQTNYAFAKWMGFYERNTAWISGKILLVIGVSFQVFGDRRLRSWWSSFVTDLIAAHFNTSESKNHEEGARWQ